MNKMVAFLFKSEYFCDAYVGGCGAQKSKTVSSHSNFSQVWNVQEYKGIPMVHYRVELTMDDDSKAYGIGAHMGSS